MVEYALNLDDIFGSLADVTRRDIIKRVAQKELSVSAIAEPYNVSLAAVSKQLRVLEQARLIEKRKHGKEHLVRLSPLAIKGATDFLQYYSQFWGAQLDSLEEYLTKENHNNA